MYPLSETAYAELCKLLHRTEGIVSTKSRRRGYEQQYYPHHKARGVKVRGKYRPENA